MDWRLADVGDASALARMNAQLIEDEGHWNGMSVTQLEDRMTRWLSTNYTAVLFEAEARVVAYALYCPHDDDVSIYLRQFFVSRDYRRHGVGTRAFTLLREQVLPTDARIVLGVLLVNTPATQFWKSLGFVEYCRMMEVR